MTSKKIKNENDLKKNGEKIEDDLKKKWRQPKKNHQKSTLLGCDIIVN